MVWALRPVRPADVDLREIGARPGETKRPPRLSPLRRRALAAAEAWVKERQEADGSWGGIQPPWVWSIVMLAALGRGFEDETLRRRGRGLGRLPRRGRRPPEARGVPVAGLGHRPGRARASRGGAPGRPPPAPQGRRVAARRGGHRQGRLVDPPSRPRSGRLGVRVRERPLPRRRRHRRRRARPPRAGHGRGRRPPRPRLDRGHAVRERRLGRLRRRQLEPLALQAPVLRLRLRDRPAERGRLRPRASRRWRPSRATPTRSPAGSTTCSASSSGTARGGAAGASTTCTAPARRCRPSRRVVSSRRIRRSTKAVDWLDSVQQTTGGFGEDISAVPPDDACAAAGRPLLHKRRGRY